MIDLTELSIILSQNKGQARLEMGGIHRLNRLFTDKMGKAISHLQQNNLRSLVLWATQLGRW